MKTSLLSTLFLLNVALVMAHAQPPEVGVSPPQTPLGPQNRPPLPEVSPQEAERLVGGPTLITLNVVRANPRQVWENIARQAGLKLDPWDVELLRRKWPLVTLRANRESFWSVMQRLSQQVDWSIEFSPETGRWRVGIYNSEEGRKWLPGIAQKIGPFRVLAAYISASSSAQLYWNTENPLVSENQQGATFNIYADPRLMPTFLSELSVLPDRADDETGHPLGMVVPSPDFQKLPRQDGVRWYLSVSWPKNPSSRSATITAKASALLAFKHERWELPVSTIDGVTTAHATRTFETSQGRVTYQVDLTQNGDGYSIKLSQPTDIAWKPPSVNFTDMPIQTTVRVVDGQGRYLYFNGGGAGAEYQVQVRRQDPWGKNGVGLPAKVIVNMPTDVRRVTFPFQFRNLPLQ